MKRRDYVHAESFGIVYRFSKRAWKRMLTDVMAGGGKAEAFREYGARVVCSIDHNVTDLDAERAEMILAYDELSDEAPAVRR